MPEPKTHPLSAKVAETTERIKQLEALPDSPDKANAIGKRKRWIADWQKIINAETKK